MQRREGAAILAGRYAPTLADARQLYPGRKINTLMAPGTDRPLVVPSKFADPDLEAEAVQVIQNAYHLAQVTGKRSHLEAALDDSAVR